MHPIIERLRESLSWAIDGAATDNEMLKRALRSTDLSPWSAWTLLSLVGHVERQRWLTSIVQTKLQGSPDAIAGAGAFAHPEEVPQHGVVPGLIDWEYYFHGCGCCLTNRRSGESIDVDFFDGSGDWIDPWFYCNYLSSLKTPGPIEHRLLQLHAPPETVHIAIRELLEHGLLQLRETSSKIFRVSVDAEQLLPVLERVEKALSSDRLLPAAIAVGEPTNITSELWVAAKVLFAQKIAGKHPPIRLLGFGIHGIGLASSARQQGLFDEPNRDRQRKLDQVADEIAAKFGKHSLRRGRSPREPQ